MNTEKLFNRNFTIMAIGQFISLFGNSLQRFALSLLILDLTGSATIFSLIVAITFVPQIILSPFGGAIADRVSKKRIMVFLDAFSGIFLIIFTVFFMNTDKPSLIAIGVLMGILSIIQSIYDPSVRAAIPAVTSNENLTQANSVVSVISSLSSLIGPIAAGFLYGLSGIRIVLIINIVSFLFSAIMELFLHIPQIKQEIRGSALKTFTGDIKDAFVYLLKEKPIILQIILISCSFNLFLTPIYTVGLPFMEKIIFNVSDQMYGISEGFVGAGMIVGAILTSVVSKKIPFKKLHYYFVVITALILAMGSCALPGIMNENGVSFLSYVLFTAFGFLFALLLAIINILCITYMQLEVPQEMMGKTMSVVSSLSIALMPVGQILFGGIYDLLSSSTWLIYVIVTALSFITTLITRRLIKNAVHNGMLAS